MRATPGLLGGAGLAAGLIYLLGRQRGKRRRRALPAAATLLLMRWLGRGRRSRA
jgi:4-amino-4-deoxy-L-arabinose transferase-like glycosyltransferase